MQRKVACMLPPSEGSAEPRLPSSPSLSLLRDRAKELHRAYKAGDPGATSRLRVHHPRYVDVTDKAIAGEVISLRDAQLVVAREHGFANWTELKKHTTAAFKEERKTAIGSLCQAAESGDLSEVTRLLDKYPDTIDSKGGQGARTPLHFAAMEGHEKVVVLLLSRGADTSVRCGASNVTPLHNAVISGHLTIVKQLLEAGADPVGAGDRGEMGVIDWATVFHGSPNDSHYVDQERRDRMVNLLRQHGTVHTIWSAVAMADLEAVREIVARDPAVLTATMKDEEHRRPLHLAVAHGHVDVACLLIESGAEVDAEDDDGLTALDHIAIDHRAHTGTSNLVQLLLGAGAHLRFPAAVLLNRTADIDRLAQTERDVEWSAYTYRASERGDAGDVQALIDHGANVSGGFPDKRDVTPLHIALYNDRSVAEVLIRNGADLAARDKWYDATPLQWAQHAGDQEMAAWLREQGAE
ncbi:MAG: hypothetical protein GKR89_09800 [Candidatus Latescibacteria bacterium]|nr:hypothetical protein [Candidatus Latescibacterota bacterium]